MAALATDVELRHLNAKYGIGGAKPAGKEHGGGRGAATDKAPVAALRDGGESLKCCERHGEGTHSTAECNALEQQAAGAGDPKVVAGDESTVNGDDKDARPEDSVEESEV